MLQELLISATELAEEKRDHKLIEYCGLFQELHNECYSESFDAPTYARHQTASIINRLFLGLAQEAQGRHFDVGNTVKVARMEV